MLPNGCELSSFNAASLSIILSLQRSAQQSPEKQEAEQLPVIFPLSSEFTTLQYRISRPRISRSQVM